MSAGQVRNRAGIRGLARLTALLVVIPSIFAADAVAWGPPANDLRLGLNSTGSAIRIVFQNDGIERDILVGARTGNGPMYHFNFTGTAPDGKECQVLYLGGAQFVAGYMEPLTVRLATEESYELLLPTNKFVYVENRKDILLGELFDRRYSIRASFEVVGGWGTTDNSWLGKVSSGDFSRSK